MRRNSWIESECSECSATVFVLPINVYPSTKSVPSEILGGTFKERLGVLTKELLRRNQTETEEQSTQKKGNKKASNKAASQTKLKPKRKLPKLSLPRFNVKRFLARTFSPFRLLMMAVIATLCLTGWYMVEKRQTDHAQKTWLQSTEVIAEKLAQQDLNGLLPELETALKAGTILEKDDAEFRRLGNLRMETQATDNLAIKGLVEVFQTVYDADNRIKPEAQARINKACDQGWFLFDAIAIKVETNAGTQWVVDFPATPGLHPVSIVLPNLLLLNDFDVNNASRVLFVAKLSVKTTPTNNEDGQWILTVIPNQFALLTHAAQCQAVGFDPDNDDSLAQIIDQQAQWVEAGRTLRQPIQNTTTEEQAANPTANPTAGQEAATDEDLVP